MDIETDDEGNLFVYIKNEKHQLAVFTGHLYKLRMRNGMPILEVDGVRMHLVKEFKNPLEYSEEIVKKLDIKKNQAVLDTCGGLGYTAMAAAKKAKKVVSCEIKKEVLTLAEYSPWSSDYFKNKKIRIYNENVYEKINDFKDGEFDAVIHDPPRFSHAPELYSADFYRKILRILKPKGKIFHYTGSLGKRKGKDILEKTAERMEKTGFKIKIKDKRLQGIFAVKG
ncbi:methyltransferase domain-containing protein [Candidatus Micrarchaeota archaeon]|nr:methyltransferase domain-containing protein [Candidatus Micrarchaeota archaeon]